MDKQELHSTGEEIANAITHGIGVIFAIAALVILIVFSAGKGAKYIVSVSIYGATLFLLYLASTLYHSLKGKAKDIFRIFDHSAIYLLIAGTYTPFTFLIIRGWQGWFLFGIIWTLAIIGILFKVFFTGRFTLLSTLLYILMGWIVVVFIESVIKFMPHNGLILLVMGGLSYTLGAVFYVFKWFKFHHAVWHLFVLAGSVLHFFAILTII